VFVQADGEETTSTDSISAEIDSTAMSSLAPADSGKVSVGLTRRHLATAGAEQGRWSRQ
jgi:hypothetical protein